MDEFKKGAFRMALQAGVPITPVVFSSYRKFLRPKDKVFDSGRIIIEALPEISTKNLQLSDINELIAKTRNLMIDKQNELNKEIE